LLKIKGINPFSPVSLIDDDYGTIFELSFFASNIRRKKCDVLDSFLSFQKTIEEKMLTTCCL